MFGVYCSCFYLIFSICIYPIFFQFTNPFLFAWRIWSYAADFNALPLARQGVLQRHRIQPGFAAVRSLDQARSGPRSLTVFHD